MPITFRWCHVYCIKFPQIPFLRVVGPGATRLIARLLFIKHMDGFYSHFQLLAYIKHSQKYHKIQYCISSQQHEDLISHRVKDGSNISYNYLHASIVSDLLVNTFKLSLATHKRFSVLCSLHCTAIQINRKLETRELSYAYHFSQKQRAMLHYAFNDCSRTSSTKVLVNS